MSWNKMNARAHWSMRDAETNRVHQLIKSTLHDLKPRPLSIRVAIRITAYFKAQPMDSDNICDKPYIDALKSVVIPDDRLDCVCEAATRSRIDKKRPRVEILIEEVDE